MGVVKHGKERRKACKSRKDRYGGPWELLRKAKEVRRELSQIYGPP